MSPVGMCSILERIEVVEKIIVSLTNPVASAKARYLQL